jgi:hypothetical protein
MLPRSNDANAASMTDGDPAVMSDPDGMMRA